MQNVCFKKDLSKQKHCSISLVADSEITLGDPILREATRSVDEEDFSQWQLLNQEAINAHEAFVVAARGAAVARHRGDLSRAELLTKLARKQHTRWITASRQMTLYEC